MIPSNLQKLNVTDTCAVWHLLASSTLFAAARSAGFAFVITQTVEYECFVKSRGRSVTDIRHSLREALRRCLHSKHVEQVSPSIEDLQDILEVARRRGLDKRLGQGELSCAALSRRLNHSAVLTDNRRDFRQIEELVDKRLQTTPRLLGWLLVEGHLNDSDVSQVIREHSNANGHLGKVYRKAYEEACEKRLMKQSPELEGDI